MEDYKTMFKKIKDEHINIKENVKLIGDSVADPEALSLLNELHTEWKSSGKELMLEKQNKLRQTFATLDEGLQNHFALEARYLPQFIGGLLVTALTLEHREIEDQIEAAKAMSLNMELEGLNHDKPMLREAGVHQTIDDLYRQIEKHIDKEEILLSMLEMGLRDSGRI